MSPSEMAAFDAYVHDHPQGTPFHRPQWSLAVERATGNRARCLVAEQGERIAGLLPLTHMRSRLFGNALVSTGFGVDGGIIADDDGTAQMLADEALRLAQQVRVPSIELRGGTLSDGWRQAGGVYAGFVRALPADEEAILKAIPRKQRAEVRRALGNDLDVTIGRDLVAHYRVYAQSVRNLGTPVFPRRLFGEMLTSFGEDADVLVVSHRGAPVAAVLSLYFRGTVYPYWGGGTHEARGLRANELMYFALMRHAAARGCTRFDFGRSKLGTGAFAYKKNWGFDPAPLTYAYWGEERDTNPLDPKFQLKVRLWKKLPLWAANRIGPVIARGLG